MADLERGRRIAWLRTEKHLTQQAVVDRLEEAAKQAGWKPKKQGHYVVTLRGYQGWEEKGGLLWDNAKLLAGVHGVESDWLWSGEPTGEPPTGETPDLVATLNGMPEDLRDRLDKMDRKLDLLLWANGLDADAGLGEVDSELQRQEREQSAEAADATGTAPAKAE